MNKIIIASVVSAISFSTAFAGLDDGIAPTMELSTGIGVVQRDDERIGLDDDGKAIAFEIRYRLPNTNFDFDLRMRNSYFDHDHDDPANVFYDFPHKGSYCQAEETKVFDGRGQLMYNFAKDATINPYVSFGIIFQKTTDKYDIIKDMNSRWYYAPIHYKYDDDGTSFIGSVGVDIRQNYIYSRLEASYFGELYDDDDGGQFELAATLGFYLCDGFRLDFFASYYTEYEDLLTTVGFCLAL